MKNRFQNSVLLHSLDSSLLAAIPFSLIYSHTAEPLMFMPYQTNDVDTKHE